VLHDGALLPKGMPRFQVFSEAQVGQIQQFIRERARAALAKDGRPSGTGPAAITQ
jgi:hypothetical protein